MKTTADAILEGQKFSVRHEGELIDVSKMLKSLVSKHYNSEGIQEFNNNVKDFSTGTRFSFDMNVGIHVDYGYDSDVVTLEAFPLVVYNKGVITISIQHDDVQKCPDCEGTGGVQCQCIECGGEDESDCDTCYGTGLLCEDWKDFQCYFDIDLPEIVHYKTIDLRQGELF